MQIEGNKFSLIYKKLCKKFIEEYDSHKLSECRGAHPKYVGEQNDLEEYIPLYNVTIVLKDPRYSSYKSYNGFHSPSLRIQNIEGKMLFSDSSNPKYVPWYKRFCREEGKSNSMYGQFISPYIELMREKLANNPTTRQCVFTIYSMKYNNWDYDVTDVPCNLNGIFDIVDDKLNLTICSRSSDMMLGLPYDIAMFTYLQQVMYNDLKKDMQYLALGTFTFILHNIHVYKMDLMNIVSLASDKLCDVPIFTNDDIAQARNRTLEYMEEVDAKKEKD